MKSNSKLRQYFWIVFVFLLVACGPLVPAQTVTPTATSAPAYTALPTFTPVAKTPTTLPTFTPDVGMPMALPTFSPLGSFPTLIPRTATFVPVPIPVTTSPKIFPLDNLRMFYIMDGNLYVQGGNNSPKRLSSGEDLYPVFFVSDDGKKIVFYHGKRKDDADIFSINADGSHEQELITRDWLTTLGTGTETGELVFVPNTHQIFFNTYLCSKDYFSLGCAVGLYLADTDTGEIKEIMPPSLGHEVIGQYENFSISPDGKLMSFAHEGQIDILSVDGKVIQRNIMKYTRSTPIELYPRVFWLSDSSGLIAALPDVIEYHGAHYSGYPAYAVWQYMFNDDVATHIPFDPPPIWVSMDCNDVMSVSPNGNWGVYHTNDSQVYIGNLVDGSSHLYLPYMYCLPAHWSSDSIHFINGGNPDQPLLGTVDKSPAFAPGYFLGWIDAKRFIYIPYSSSPVQENIQILVGEIVGETLLTYKSNVSIPDIYPYSFTFTMLGGK